MPLEKPFARAQPGGCRICLLMFVSCASQLEALQLAALGARKRVDELHGARVLVGRDGLFHMVLQSPSCFLAAFGSRLQNHEGLHDRPALGSGAPTTPHSATAGCVSSAPS